MDSYKNKKVLIFGLGLNDGGLGMAEYFLNKGAIVTITDGKTEEQLHNTLDKLKKYEGKIIYHLGGHIKDDFLNNYIVIRNPAIKPDNEWLRIASNAGKQIEMEMSLFHKLCPCPIIGITGTKGKSTTTTLVFEFLKKKYGDKVFLGGNIGRSAIRELKDLDSDSLAVLELSSFQLDTMGENMISPNSSLITNIYTDHIDWHGNFKEYVEAKKNIFKYQKNDEYVSLNIDDEVISSFKDEPNSKVITYSLKDPNANYYMDSDWNVYENGNLLFSVANHILDGKHNMYNILGAISLARIYSVNTEDILNVLEEFKGVNGREEFIREINGIKFFNDTTSTSVEAMLAMFERFGESNKGKIVMIAGGVDKGLEYEKIESSMKKYLKSLVLFEGSASEKISGVLKDSIDIHKYYSDYKEAIDKAYSLAESGDMIILCPGASSFNMFANEFDRGDKFVEYVNLLK